MNNEKILARDTIFWSAQKKIPITSPIKSPDHRSKAKKYVTGICSRCKLLKLDPNPNLSLLVFSFWLHGFPIADVIRYNAEPSSHY